MRRNYSIWDEMQRMQEQMDSLFDSFFSRNPFVPQLENSTKQLQHSNQHSLPRNYRNAQTDIQETNKEVIAQVELPGVDKKDIQINATKDGIEVQVEKNVEHEDKEDNKYRYERRYAGFYRFIPAPSAVNAEDTKAKYENGMLELRMPKIKENKKEGKKIPLD